MGSLVAGWNSPRSKKSLERTKSLLNEEIENFWTIKHKAQEEHMKALSEDVSNTSSDDFLLSELGGSDSQSLGASNPPKLLEISSRSFGSEDRADNQFAEDTEKQRKMKIGWWTRSNSAFLNDPPLIEMDDTAHKYAAQYDAVGRKPGFPIDGVTAEGNQTFP